ncbi:hypothetical protein C8E87_2211 [Paractinoplanes brasiliensis]|uniref:Uncharacterized protein n=1 Tax=Paractinoplanes brasiliensis TaxID=52695 RepID=A0A4R6JPU0_9ACTN|nr:hypothetical protein C8E87_2211 [Actinoplanes brasiliensis]GID26672.1 hypothetical protein Abr02nite_16550 [Actinoplanes brasiliensis]
MERDDGCGVAANTIGLLVRSTPSPGAVTRSAGPARAPGSANAVPYGRVGRGGSRDAARSYEVRTHSERDDEPEPAAPFIPPVWYRARPWDPPITNDAACL